MLKYLKYTEAGIQNIIFTGNIKSIILQSILFQVLANR